MKVLVTGAKGQLGYDVLRHLKKRQIECWGIDIEDCNLTKREEVDRVFVSYKPDAIVHCAAYTAVDKAEENEEICRLVNVGGTENVARAAKEAGAQMMYISTDYIFSGEGDRAFEANDTPAPQNVYGRTKWEGEEAARSILEKYFIVRISWVFGLNGANFVKTMLKLGAEKETISVVSDQIGSPTYTDALAPLLCDMIETEKYGVYHATNEGFCSWYEFAKEIMRQAGLLCKIIPVETKNYKTAAQRPHNSRLSKRSLDEAGFARLPEWKDSLKDFIEKMLVQ